MYLLYLVRIKTLTLGQRSRRGFISMTSMICPNKDMNYTYVMYVASSSISSASLLATSLKTEKLCVHAMFMYLLYLVRNKALELGQRNRRGFISMTMSK